MKKKYADEMKQIFDVPCNYQDAVALIGTEQVTSYLTHLDRVGNRLAAAISDYSLDFTHDLLDQETNQIIRVFWFSRGLQNYYLCINGSGMIRAVDIPMPTGLFDQILSVLNSFDEK